MALPVMDSAPRLLIDPPVFDIEPPYYFDGNPMNANLGSTYVCEDPFFMRSLERVKILLSQATMRWDIEISDPRDDEDLWQFIVFRYFLNTKP